ncbi:hypothetical protein IGI39_003809 [Enterococcus sp. AZ135]|uniref:hypothetical protein n=1 Tax=unclassified Enterococcus TaxID=2608891 RepID=UPI003F2614DB
MKKTVQTKPLSQVQLFVTKRSTLEPKIISYFEHTKNVSAVIQYAVAIMVKNALVLSDYSYFLKDLVRELFMTAEPSDVLRKNLAYFKPYFKSGEFERIISRLFTNKKEYLEHSKAARLTNKYLYAEHTLPMEDLKYGYNLVSVFKATNGKKYSWTLRDIHPAMAEEEKREDTRMLLKILTTLTIFQQGEIRKFAQFVKFDYFEGANVSHYEEPQEELQQEIDPLLTERPKEKLTIRVPYGFDPRTLSDTEALVLIRSHLPEGRTLEDVEVLFVERPAETADQQKNPFTPPVISDFGIAERHPAVGVADPVIAESTKTQIRNNTRPRSGSQLSAVSLIDKWKNRQNQSGNPNKATSNNGNNRKKKKR